ncbi:Ankrd28 [Symbiodinium sp. KB8]|nr:Ankrd28 [Symbiodinium sp. KB8]
MAMFAQLWEYWHSRQYEEAAGEVCRLVGVEEEAFSSQRQLLTAAGALHASECPAWSEEDRSVALLGRNCCNRLAERHLRNSNWPEAARWCALAWRLEGGQSCASLWLEDGSWAAARYQRLFHAAEVFRLACKGGQKASKASKKPAEEGFDGSEYLQASRRCLETCEAILQRWPTCTANPEGIYTCLAEICWQLKDIAAVRWSCRQALSLLSPVAGLTCARAYAGLFVLWVFQSAALEAFSWREVRAALHCASDLFHRLESAGIPEDQLGAHRRLLRRLQRQGGVAGASDTDEVQLDLGFLSGSGGSGSLQPEEQAAPLSREACRVEGSKVEVATMTEHVPEPEVANCPGPGDCGCREGWLTDDPERPEILAFLASLAGGEAKRPQRRRWQPLRSSGQGRLDDLLAAAEAATPKSCLSGMPIDPQVAPSLENAALPSSPVPPQSTKEEAGFLEAEMSSPTAQEEHGEGLISENFAQMKRAVALPTSPGCDPSHANSPELEPHVLPAQAKEEHWPRPWLSHANLTLSTAANGEVSFCVTSAVEDARCPVVDGIQADEVYYERASPKVDLLQRLADWQSTKPGNEVGKKADAAAAALPCGPIGPSAARLRRCTACDSSSPHSSTRNLVSSLAKDKDSNGKQQTGRQAGIRLTARARPASLERPIAKTARTPRSASLPEKMRRLARSAPANQASPEQRHTQQKQATTKPPSCPGCRPTAASGYVRPPLSSRPELPARQHHVHRRHAKASEECSTHAASSCSSSEPVEAVIRLSSADCSRVTSASSSPRRCISVEVRAKDCVWAYRGVRRQVEAPHLYFGHVPRSTFESHGCSRSTRSFGG